MRASGRVRLLWQVFVFLLIGLVSAAARAEVHALLIGVSGYPSFAPERRLKGPPQDVVGLRDALLHRGVSPRRIRLLADGVADAGSPTRAAIFAALDALAREARPGDVVFVHFTGHGSRQPDRTQPGVLVPTLLPMDIGRWDGGSQTVVNALTRDEVRDAIDRIGARGVFVWAAFDACHSSGLVRGGDAATAGAVRGVEPGDLGVPDATVAAWPPGYRTEAPSTSPGTVRSGAADGEPATSGRGRAVFFYATQAGEVAGELDLPDADGAVRRHGLFSHTISSLLDQLRPMSYRQLAQAIQARFRTMDNATWTPVFAGDGLDTQVLGQGTLAVRQWPLRRAADGAWHVGAGRLHGIAVGAWFAVVPNALARDDDSVGYVEATEVGADDSRVVPVARNDRPAPADAALVAGVAQLRLVASPPAYALRVAFDPSGCTPPCRLRDAIQRLRSSGVPSVDLRWVEATDTPDLLLRQHAGRALLLSPAQRTASTVTGRDMPGFDLETDATADEIGKRLATHLHAHARLRNLAALAALSAIDPIQGTLDAALRRRSDSASIDIAAQPTLHHGDRLLLRLTNRGEAVLNLTVFYLDAALGVKKLFPTKLGHVALIEKGETREIPVVIQPPAIGREGLMVIAAQLRQHDFPVDFGFLEQASMPERRDASEEVGELLSAFADAGFADYTTRRDGQRRPSTPSPRTLIRNIEFEVRP